MLSSELFGSELQKIVGAGELKRAQAEKAAAIRAAVAEDSDAAGSDSDYEEYEEKKYAVEHITQEAQTYKIVNKVSLEAGHQTSRRSSAYVVNEEETPLLSAHERKSQNDRVDLRNELMSDEVINYINSPSQEDIQGDAKEERIPLIMPTRLEADVMSGNDSQKLPNPVETKVKNEEVPEKMHKKSDLYDPKKIHEDDMPLIRAIINNDENEVARLLKLKTNSFRNRFVDESDSIYKMSPLHWAAALEGRSHFIKPLLDAEAEINKQNGNGETATFVAAATGNQDAIRTLALKKADINLANINGETPVFAAAKNNQPGAISRLAYYHADVCISNKEGKKPIFIAAENGHESAVIVLLAAEHSDINERNHAGETLVFVAAKEGHEKIIETLSLDPRLKIDIPNIEGKTPIFIATENGHPKAITALREAYADIEQRNNAKETLLCVAARLGKVNSMEALTNKLEMTCEHRRTPFSKKKLIKKETKADIEKKNGNGETPLFVAVFFGKIGAIKFLIEQGADVNEPNKDRKTPLMIAIEKKDVEAVEVLLLAGADQNFSMSGSCCCSSSLTALEMVKEPYSSDVICYVVKERELYKSIETYRKSKLESKEQAEHKNHSETLAAKAERATANLSPKEESSSISSHESPLQFSTRRSSVTRSDVSDNSPSVASVHKRPRGSAG